MLKFMLSSNFNNLEILQAVRARELKLGAKIQLFNANYCVKFKLISYNRRNSK